MIESFAVLFTDSRLESFAYDLEWFDESECANGFDINGDEGITFGWTTTGLVDDDDVPEETTTGTGVTAAVAVAVEALVDAERKPSLASAYRNGNEDSMEAKLREEKRPLVPVAAGDSGSLFFPDWWWFDLLDAESLLALRLRLASQTTPNKVVLNLVGGGGGGGGGGCTASKDDVGADIWDFVIDDDDDMIYWS